MVTESGKGMELAVRLGIFALVFAALIVAERMRPRWGRGQARGPRWVTNVALLVLGNGAVWLAALALPLLAVAAAADAGRAGFGLFQWLDWPAWAEGLLAVAILDLVLWAQHLVMHKVPGLWRLHRVHHADPDMDVTTALRFHPGEFLFSAAVKVGAVWLIGPAVWAVVVFEVILSATALFTHADIRLPPQGEALLARVLVTPAMHRTHHAPERALHDGNYGFALSVWDRLAGTYRAEGRADGRTGLGWAAGPERLGWSLALPFRAAQAAEGRTVVSRD
jgi:sterol desaturase/sphingolipid hydroxylase (fatty acid hydroxylase superfamily)